MRDIFIRNNGIPPKALHLSESKWNELLCDPDFFKGRFIIEPQAEKLTDIKSTFPDLTRYKVANLAGMSVYTYTHFKITGVAMSSDDEFMP
jgi:hypothetical protein